MILFQCDKRISFHLVSGVLSSLLVIVAELYTDFTNTFLVHLAYLKKFFCSTLHENAEL